MLIWALVIISTVIVIDYPIIIWNQLHFPGLIEKKENNMEILVYKCEWSFVKRSFFFLQGFDTVERLNESGELREMLKPYQVIRN